jgi:hypothetical protein
MAERLKHALASRDRDGRVRERALRALLEDPDGGLLPVWLERVSDWVPVIAGLARNRLLHYLAPLYLPAWIDYVDLLIEQMGKGRSQATAWTQPVLDYIAGSRPLLVALLQRGKRALPILRQLTMDQSLRELLLQNPHPLLRWLGARELPQEERSRLRTDPFPPIRAEAVVPSDFEWARLDRSRRVRERAIYEMRKHGDPALYYRELLSLGQDVELALQGLARCGVRADAARALDWFAPQRSARIRRNALVSAYRLDPSILDVRLFEVALRDPADSVVREALRLQGGQLPADRLMQLARRPALTKLALHWLFLRHRWDGLIFLAEQGMPLQAWFQRHGARGWNGPSAIQKGRLLELLPAERQEQLGFRS